MKYTFSRHEQKIDTWSGITRSLEETLEEIRSAECSYADLHDFCMKAAADAQPAGNKRSMVFWGYADPAEMPRDAFCEFFLLPTYVMVRCLIAAVLREPALMLDANVKDTLEQGLNGCTVNGLLGHGYEAEEILYYNLRCFLKAGYADFVMRYPSVSPAFRTMFTNALRAVRKDHDEGRHIFGWACDLKNEQEMIIAETPARLLGDYSCRENERLYIAYGSNMDEAQMAVRCPGAELVGIGTIRRAQLDFYLYATVTDIEDPAATVPAAVWKITGQHERSLDRYEGVRGHYYYKDTAKVLLNNGIEVEGLIYLMENFRQQPCDPVYFDRIAAAYDRLGLHDRISDVLEPAWDRSMDR